MIQYSIGAAWLRTIVKQRVIGNNSMLQSALAQSCSNLCKNSNFSTAINASPFNSRKSASSLSLETAIYQNPEIVKSHLNSRKYVDIHSIEGENKQDVIDILLHTREKRNNLIKKSNQLRNQKKILSSSIGKLMKESSQLDAVIDLKKQVELITQENLNLDKDLSEIETNMKNIQMFIPNLLDDRVPDGADDSCNVVVSSWGDDLRKMFDSTLLSESSSENKKASANDSDDKNNNGNPFRWHDDLAIGLGGLHSEAASRLSGTRFSILTGNLARLERAIIQYFLDFHSNRGYTEVSVPYIVSRSTMEGTGQLPKFEDDLFKVSHKVGGEDAFLIPTSEVPVTNLLRDQLIDLTSLPYKYVCYSPCFRAEAGSNGRDTRGLLRQHQFHKVELVKICNPDSSDVEHEAMVNDAEELLQSLNLPYRKLLLCSGDTGFSARLCYDLEVWLPSQQMYREISSISNCHDFQSRRMKLRCRPPKNSDHMDKIYPHTINGSGVAVGRALVAILENYQNNDGSVSIPDKLIPYMGGLKVLPVQARK